MASERRAAAACALALLLAALPASAEPSKGERDAARTEAQARIAEAERLARETAAAEATRARIVHIDNMYMYGPQTAAPLHEDLPLTAYGVKPAARSEASRMWQKAAREGRVRWASLRAPDFYGPGVDRSHIGETGLGAIAQGRTMMPRAGCTAERRRLLACAGGAAVKAKVQAQHLLHHRLEHRDAPGIVEVDADRQVDLVRPRVLLEVLVEAEDGIAGEGFDVGEHGCVRPLPRARLRCPCAGIPAHRWGRSA